MYIIKFTKNYPSLFLHVQVWSKEWSDELNSNTVRLLDEKKTLFFFVAKKWSHGIIIKDIFMKKKLEVIHG